MASVSRWRRAAKRAGLRWADVAGCYAELKDQAREARARENDVRRTAWVHDQVHRPYRWPFWRVGFATIYGAKVERRDVTAIPGYDTLAQEIGGMFPEWADRCDELWEFLLSPYRRLPAADELYDAAIDRLVELRRREKRERRKEWAAAVVAAASDDVPF